MRVARFAPQRPAKRDDIGVAGIAEERRVADPDEPPRRISIVARRGQAVGRREGQEAPVAAVGVVHLLRQLMPAEALVELHECPRLREPRRDVVRRFLFAKQPIDDRVARVWILEIQLALLADALRRSEEEHLVLDQRTTERQARVVAAKRQRLRSRLVQRIRRIERIVPEEQRADAVEKIAAALGDDVDDGAGGLPELRLVAARQHLKLGDGLLIELLRRSAVDGVLVRLPVDQEIVVPAPLTQHRIGPVAVRIDLAVDGHAGHELQEIEVVPAVDRRFGDLARSNRRARRRG